MDMLPRIGGVDPYAGGGGSQQRPGGGSRPRREQREGSGRAAEDEPAELPPPDPLLAEIDRLRALDPRLTESAAQRALGALRAYQGVPGEPSAPTQDVPPPAADAAAVPTTRRMQRRAEAYRPPPTPPGPATGEDAPGA